MAEVSTDTTVVVGGTPATPSPGHAGIESQVPGATTSVSSVAGATGGLAPGNLVETAIDEQLFKFESDDTPLMQLMLFAKRVNIDSPEVQHFAIDEPRATVTTTAACGDGTTDTVTLPLSQADKKLLNAYTTVLVKGVDGYLEDGTTVDTGKDLMLFVTKKSDSSDPVAIAVNGSKTNASDESTLVPTIPAGTELVILSNAMSETQEQVAPDLVVPQPQLVYCQKRGMNSIVSDYFDAQKKRIPFTKALIAEAQIRNFKVKGNRSLWASRARKFYIDTPLGPEVVYTTEGVRWSIKRHLDHVGKWTFEELIALAKMVFTGEDVPKNVVMLAGKNFIQNIQCIDYSKHPEVQITVKTNPVGWKVTAIHTVFGEFEIKHEPTLDKLGWENSAAVIAYDRLVHYVYSAEHKKNEKVEGREAKREATLVWDALALKGSAHIWIDGEGKCAATGTDTFIFWDSETAPTDPVAGKVYVLLSDCTEIDEAAVAGTMWVATVSEGTTTWSEYTGSVTAS
ncbi:MAG: hypothetical protein Q4E59_00740 [Bacteroidales bacterium]|nr:hypothetical protein [Bacteroidales bacterium]